MMLIGQALRVAQMTSRCRKGVATVLGAAPPKRVHPKFKGADTYAVFDSRLMALTVILSEAKNLVVHRGMRCFAAPSLFLRYAQDFGSGLRLSMARLRLLLTRLKSRMHPPKLGYGTAR